MSRFRGSLAAMATPGRMTRKPFSTHLSDLRLEWDSDSAEEQFDANYLSKLVTETRDVFERGEIVTNAKILKHLSQALWDEEFRLADDESFAKFYIECLSACSSKGPLRSIARQYLFHWPQREGQSGAIGNFVRDRVRSVKSGWLHVAATNDLFDSDRGIAPLAQEICGSSEPPDDILATAGLRGGNRSGRYAETVFIKACDLVGSKPDRGSYKRLAMFLFDRDAGEYDFKFTSGIAANAFVGALLGPWQNSPPPGPLQKWVLKLLLAAFDDPRLTVGRWQGVEEKYVSILKRWLAKASLEQFLNIVDQSITDIKKRRMWSYRRPFWTSYFENGLIQEAWVLFGRGATRLAEQAAQQDRTFNNSYGFLASSDASHSVLLMKIGDITIAEWSHNGRCWIWRSPRGAPKLYKGKMTDHACRGAPFGQTHSGALHYRWQQAVANELNRLGVPNTPSASWRP